MSKKFKILAGFLLLGLGTLIYLESSEEAPINWFPSYAQKDKIPYGSYVLYNTLKDARTDGDIVEVFRPPYEFLADSSDQKGTYFFLNDYIYFDDTESESLLAWVAQGNTLYIGAKNIGYTILDTLNLEIETLYDLNNFESKPLVQLVNKNLKREQPYYLDIEVTPSIYFEELDTLNTTVLGSYGMAKSGNTLAMDESRVHFVKQAFGQGAIIIHLMPDVFTNYFMLKDENYAYTESVLQYLPENGTIFWDNHHKNGKVIYTSPLYVLFQNRYLKWAYYLLLIGVALWVLFEGKRKQRAIPIIKPLPNQTLTFTKTIAGMYLEKSDHKSVATHQINHFKAYIRSEWLLPTDDTGLEFITQLANKSNNTVEATKRLVDYMTAINQRHQITEAELLKLNSLIEAYKNA